VIEQHYRRHLADRPARAFFVVQQGLRTPTELRFENCGTRGIRGLLFGLLFTRRSTNRTALFFAVA
jgi:hypothetical protein